MGPLRISVANGCNEDVNCRLIGPKKYLKKVEGGVEFGTSFVGMKIGGKLAYEHSKINDFGFTTVGPGHSLEFTTSSKEAYITIEIQGKLICNNKEVNENTGYVIDKRQHLIKATSIDKTKKWIDEYGTNIKELLEPIAEDPIKVPNEQPNNAKQSAEKKVGTVERAENPMKEQSKQPSNTATSVDKPVESFERGSDDGDTITANNKKGERYFSFFERRQPHKQPKRPYTADF